MSVKDVVANGRGLASDRALRRSHQYHRSQLTDELVFQRRGDCSYSFPPVPDWISDLDIKELFFVVRHDDAVVGCRNSGDNRVECASRSPRGPGIGHERRPYQSGFSSNERTPPANRAWWSLRSGEPSVKRLTLSTFWLFQECRDGFQR